MKLREAKDYPKEIHIGEETYEIRVVKKMPSNLKGCVGACDPGKHVIYIKKGLTKSQMFRTFIHECLHAIEFEFEIPIKHKTIYQLEKAITDTILSNF